jgi:hypothetical protein
MNRLIYRKLLRPGVPAANRAPKAHAAVAAQVLSAPQRTHNRSRSGEHRCVGKPTVKEAFMAAGGRGV